MKTTLELPEELMQRVKLHAIHRKQKLKDAIAQLLELGLAAPEAQARARPPKPVRLRKGKRITIDDIEAAIAAGGD